MDGYSPDAPGRLPADLADDIRRFVTHAADLAAEQERARGELEAVRAGLDRAAAALGRTAEAYGKTYERIARREREGIAVSLSEDIGSARDSIAEALAEPLASAERIVRYKENAAFVAALTGGLLGAAAAAGAVLALCGGVGA